MTRGGVDLQCGRLSGAQSEYPLPPRGGREDRVPAHAQRLRRGAAAHAHRDPRKQPAAGRLGAHPEDAAAVYGRHGTDHAAVASRLTLLPSTCMATPVVSERTGGTLDDLQKLVALCKRRGLIFPSAEIYGGFANSYDYGP